MGLYYVSVPWTKEALRVCKQNLLLIPTSWKHSSAVNTGLLSTITAPLGFQCFLSTSPASQRGSKLTAWGTEIPRLIPSFWVGTVLVLIQYSSWRKKALLCSETSQYYPPTCNVSGWNFLKQTSFGVHLGTAIQQFSRDRLTITQRPSALVWTAYMGVFLCLFLDLVIKPSQFLSLNRSSVPCKELLQTPGFALISWPRAPSESLHSGREAVSTIEGQTTATLGPISPHFTHGEAPAGSSRSWIHPIVGRVTV